MTVDQLGDLYIDGGWHVAGSGEHTVVTNPTTEDHQDGQPASRSAAAPRRS